MVNPLLSWLAACAVDPDLTNTIRGIQIVAIEAIPADPDPNELLTLKTWVADGIGRGADVLVWICTPFEGQCLEASPPGLADLPLSAFTRVGQADTMFESTNPWPLFASLSGGGLQLPGSFGGGDLLVWALACAPGVCPIIDQVAIDPVAGSEAWAAAATMLADPSVWVDELPRGQVSLALKAVAVFDPPPLVSDTGLGPYGIGPIGTDPTERNHAPTLVPLVVEREVTRFLVTDPDEDTVLTRSFTTAGGVSQVRNGDDGLGVSWQEPLLTGREPVRFVVAEDGRGGTAVWCSDPATDPCNPPTVSIGSIRDGDPFPVEPWGYEPSDFRFVVPFVIRAGTNFEVQIRLSVAGELVASERFETNPGQVCRETRGTQTLFPAGFAQMDRCSLLGHVATIEITADAVDHDEHLSAAVDVVLTGTDALGCQAEPQ